MYNLAFGDADSETGLINDKITTNNDDWDIVLATVANTINSFCDHNGDHYIFAAGSSPARTRLYQMGINRLLGAVVKNLKSHANNPYVLKKLEQAKAILSKVDLSNIEKK